MPPDARLSEGEIADLERWVRIGAPDPRSTPTEHLGKRIDVAADREHWSLRPILDPAVPAVHDGEKGRGHHSACFSSWLAGGGVQGGITYGSTDDIAATVAENGVHVHDFHATILHLLGIDHERLTYRHAGRDYRPTDVHGRVVRDILARGEGRGARDEAEDKSRSPLASPHLIIIRWASRCSTHSMP